MKHKPLDQHDHSGVYIKKTHRLLKQISIAKQCQLNSTIHFRFRNFNWTKLSTHVKYQFLNNVALPGWQVKVRFQMRIDETAVGPTRLSAVSFDNADPISPSLFKPSLCKTSAFRPLSLCVLATLRLFLNMFWNNPLEKGIRLPFRLSVRVFTHAFIHW